jgi:DNA repair protein RecO (recombination protein O)
MFIDTVGIALKQTLFGDNDIIIKILTRKLGVVSFMVKGGRKSNKKKYLQPLMVIQVSFKYNKKKSLQYLNQIQLHEVSSEMLINYHKRAVALFLCEIISRCLKEGSQDEGVYNFIYNQINWINQKSNSVNNFDIWFLANFTKTLGISPNYYEIQKESINFFNIETASFVGQTKKGNWSRESSIILYELLNMDTDHLKNFSLNNNLSKFVLDGLVKYYSFHLDDLKLTNCLGVYNSLKL